MAEENDWTFVTDIKKCQELLTFWNKEALRKTEEIKWYREELATSQEILGRVMIQFSERWDTVTLTNYPRKRLK